MWWSSVIQFLWLSMASFLLESPLCAGIKIFVGGDKITPGEKALIISNHRTRIDWMLLWCLFSRASWLSSLKIVLKRQLKSAPGFGWAMQFFLFVFLHRKWEDDKEYMEKVLKTSAYYKKNVSLLIFPEGTDLSNSNLEKSREYAQKEGLCVFNHVLHPRSKGFIHCLETLSTNIDAVYDITIGYVDYVKGERPSEKSLYKGRWPPEIHFYCKRYELSKLPKGHKELEAWINQRFAEKELILDEFYKQGTFYGKKCDPSPMPRSNYFGFLTFLSSVLVSFYFIYICPLWSLLTLIGICLALILITKLFDGVDGIVLKLFNKSGLKVQ
eukprot:NODE_4270_length_1196_cov_42.374651_g3768_i0.p1 GENE.NODE_4270_length_1196_cov_42.374651_g3768_i0~~NODE_4270_length_1196_cov_42.374651_g3768_i0.p1  ORF type:complete len:374 (+),score=32.26 NODE_4270_length_1196_cov_42.374651_g3768_i0:143-1123(+)